MSTLTMKHDLIEAVRSGGKRMIIFGVIGIILGLLAMAAPVLTGLSIGMLLGAFVTVAGIFRIIWAFEATSFGKGVLAFVLGALTLVCGMALLANPMFTAAVLTIILATYFIVDGIFEIALGFGRKGGGWWVVAGIVSILLGSMLWAQFPLSGPWAMGILFGIKLIFMGLIMITGGSVIREVAET